MSEAEAQAWVEQFADSWTSAPALLPGITECGCRAVLAEPLGPIRFVDPLFGRTRVAAFEFYAIWSGVEFTTRRKPLP